MGGRGGGGGGRGGSGGGRGGESRDRGNREEIPTSAADLLIQHRDGLSLTTDQLARVTTLKNQYDNESGPLLAKLDSIRPVNSGIRGGGYGAGSNAMDAEMSDSMRTAMRERMRQRADAMNKLHDLAKFTRDHAFDLLDGDQRKKAEAYETQQQRELDDMNGDPRSRGNGSGNGSGNGAGGSGGSGRRGGMGGMRPPA
jgi:hypothetical protein